MKRAIVLIAAAILAASLAGAQSEVTFGQASSEHYLVLSELGGERAAALSRQLEAYFGLYNGIFRFDPAALRSKLNIREFMVKGGFDSYLGQVVGQTKDDFVYLHYPSPERSELLVFGKTSRRASHTRPSSSTSRPSCPILRSGCGRDSPYGSNPPAGTTREGSSCSRRTWLGSRR
jgi:hypothetical protein